MLFLYGRLPVKKIMNNSKEYIISTLMSDIRDIAICETNKISILLDFSAVTIYIHFD